MWVGQQKSGSANFLSFCQQPVLMSNQACNQAATSKVYALGASQLAISAASNLPPQLFALCDTVEFCKVEAVPKHPLH